MTNPVHWEYDDSSEMQLRLRPLRDHWEARGPGMLRYAQKLLPWTEVPERVDVRLVDPKNGGGGCVVNGAIEFEAVLANRIPQLPEVVRLAWLVLCQATKASDVHAIALIPPTLAAAEYVELARCDEVTLDLAIAEWLATSTSLTGSKLSNWWTAASEASDEATWMKSCSSLAG